MTEGNDSVLHAFGATAVAEPIVMHSATFTSSTVRTQQTVHGTHVIEGIRIFKAGTFADSAGVVRTWTPEHLDQMVLHFNLLREGGFLPNVPIREDHSFSVRDVCGYFVNIYRDPTDADFLAADIEITEPEAFEKWKRGTYRSRSIELGAYETNGEAPITYYPVILGLAFVDIPAVEGLHSRRVPLGSDPQANANHSKENTMTEEEFLAACRYAAWVQAAEYAQTCADWEAAVNYAAAVEAHNSQASELGLTTSAHGYAGAPMTFSVNGQPVQDGTTVQAHISGLEQFRAETITGARNAFVESLATHGKVGQPQVDSLKALVATMTDEQYNAFKASYDSQGSAPIFGQYGQNGNGAGGQPPTPAGGTAAQTLDEQINIQEEIVAHHKAAGRSQEEIEAMPSFKKLTDLKAQKAQG